MNLVHLAPPPASKMPLSRHFQNKPHERRYVTCHY